MSSSRRLELSWEPVNEFDKLVPGMGFACKIYEVLFHDFLDAVEQYGKDSGVDELSAITFQCLLECGLCQLRARSAQC